MTKINPNKNNNKSPLGDAYDRYHYIIVNQHVSIWIAFTYNNSIPSYAS